MKHYILLLAFVLMATLAPAQITHTQNGNVDQNAEKVLKKAAQKMNASAVSFTVTAINKDSAKKETSRQTAQVLFNKGKYRVSVPDNVIYCDGASVWHWNKQANECTVDKMSASNDDLMNPAGLLSNYSKNYKAKYIRTESDGTAVVDLTPKKSRGFYKIRLLVNSANGELKKMSMHNYDSSCSEYVVSNFKSGVAVSAADFSFPAAKNPKVEVIDMR